MHQYDQYSITLSPWTSHSITMFCCLNPTKLQQLPGPFHYKSPFYLQNLNLWDLPSGNPDGILHHHFHFLAPFLNRPFRQSRPNGRHGFPRPPGKRCPGWQRAPATALPRFQCPSGDSGAPAERRGEPWWHLEIDMNKHDSRWYMNKIESRRYNFMYIYIDLSIYPSIYIHIYIYIRYDILFIMKINDKEEVFVLSWPNHPPAAASPGSDQAGNAGSSGALKWAPRTRMKRAANLLG